MPKRFDPQTGRRDYYRKFNLDPDLAAIAGLNGTGYAKRIGVDDWVLDSGTGAQHDHVYHEELGSGSSGASWQFSQAHVSGSERVYLNNLPLRRVAGSPGVNDYTIDVPTYTITLWASKNTGDFLEVDYEISTPADHSHVLHEVLGDGLPGAVWNLDSTPVSGSERVYLNNLPLRRKTSGPGINEYTISGAQITLWASKATGDHLEADYLT